MWGRSDKGKVQTKTVIKKRRIIDRVAIYALRDPRTGEVRYIGYSQEPKAALNSMLSKSWAENTEALADWLHSMRMTGVTPKLEIMEYVDKPDVIEKRRRWLALAARVGWPLVNTNLLPDGWIAPQTKWVEPDPDPVGWPKPAPPEYVPYRYEEYEVEIE
ncbi:MAG: hypothetical protein KDE53_40660, partial [Caldilineaceae bacterium]|nr:hypothetical protein [Caldilineaceae bacterium]